MMRDTGGPVQHMRPDRLKRARGCDDVVQVCQDASHGDEAQDRLPEVRGLEFARAGRRGGTVSGPASICGVSDAAESPTLSGTPAEKGSDAVGANFD